MIEVLIVDNDEKIHIELPKLFSGALVSFKHSFTFQDAVIKLSQQEFSLLITDAFVGELSGVELIKICSEYRPNTKVLIVHDDNELSLVEDELQTIKLLSKLSKPLDARQIYKLFSDEFNVDPAEFLSADARDALNQESDSDNSKSSSLNESSTESLEENVQINSSSDTKDQQIQGDSSQDLNSSKQGSPVDEETFKSQSKIVVQDDPKTIDQLSLSVTAEDILLEDEPLALDKYESTDSIEELSENQNDSAVNPVEKDSDTNSDGGNLDSKSQVESFSIKDSETAPDDSYISIDENDELTDNLEHLSSEEQQLIDNDDLSTIEDNEVIDQLVSNTSFTDSFGQEEDDLTEQILYLDSLVSEMEFVDEEISDSDVTDRVSEEIQIETVKERKERLEQAALENLDEDAEDEASAENEQQDASIKYPEKKRPDDPYITIIVSPDQLEAYLVLYPHEEDFHSAGDIKKELDQAGVVYGIEHRKIAELLDQVNNDRKAALGEVVAKGQPAIPGKDAEILYEFSLEQPELVIIEDEFGRVDYKDIYQIDSVQEGDLVATLVPSEPPEDGTSVLGTPIVGKTGMETRVMNGKNCFFDEGDLRFYAEITGQPLLKNNKIVIVPIFTVAGDVDLSVGNINFLGSIVVNGNVNAGFSITASEDIRVLGNVEGAFLKAGGEIAIKKGFIGGDKGQISAVRHIAVKHCANGTMKCDGDILVEQYVLNSDVSCKGKLKSMTGKGCIIGGLNRAVKGIECLSLGSELGVHTNAIAGDNYLVAEMLKKINRYLKLFNERMNKIRKGIDIFTQRLSDRSDLSSKIKELQKILKLLIQREQVLKSQKEKLLKRLNLKCNAKIKVKNTVFPNVKIQVGNSVLKINDALIGCAFSEDKYRSVIHLGSFE